MIRLNYDFHIHSCLSPCGDNDMTPCNIAGMAFLAGLNVVALTDHNSVGNCKAFFKAAERYGIIPIAGMELTSAEDIHIVCLFEKLEEALAFGAEVDNRRIRIKNRTDIFGEQLLLDADDNVIGSDEYLLPNATTIAIDEVSELVKAFNGICYPAHIDRESNGIVATLGVFPEDSGFDLAELHDMDKRDEYVEKFPVLGGMKIMYGSDAHYLDKIDAGQELVLDNAAHDSVYIDGQYDAGALRHAIFEKLRGK